MKPVELEVALLEEGASWPSQAYSGDGAFDLHSCEEATVEPGRRQTVRSGIGIAVPEGYAGLVLPRSGLADRYGVTVLNSPGLVDSGYRGDVRVVLMNTSEEPFHVQAGDRIAQLMIVELPDVHLRQVDVLSPGVRGAEGLGSSGR